MAMLYFTASKWRFESFSMLYVIFSSEFSQWLYSHNLNRYSYCEAHVTDFNKISGKCASGNAFVWVRGQITDLETSEGRN